jgi:HPr kinase/phosphorylase
LNLHATCVAHGGKGLLILGKSGAGKSSLALAMIALGAELVADDRTDIAVLSGQLIASAPEPLQGMIEARGIGLLRLPYMANVALMAAVDMDQTESERLPPLRQMELMGHQLELIHGSHYLHFPAALMCYLMSARAL